MAKINIKKYLEVFILILSFSILLWAGCAKLWDNKIQHDFPFGYLASDTFQHQTRTQGIKEAGNYRYEQFYNMAGLEGVIGYYPPLHQHLGVIFSYITGLEVYDAAYLLIFLLACFGILTMYVIIRDFNKNIAVLSLPAAFLIFSGGPYTGFTWGHWPAVVAQVFLVMLFWAYLRINLKKSYLLIGVIISALILTHTSEAVFTLLFITLYFVFTLLLRRFKFSDIKTTIIGGLISFIITFYFLVMFKFIWGYQAQFGIVKESIDRTTFYLTDFKILLIFVILGIIFSIYQLYKKRFHIAVISSLSMLLIGYSNYYGLGYRPFELRIFWPVFLCFFFGAGIYFLIKLFIRRYKFIYSIIIALVFIILINSSNNINLIPKTSRFTTNGLMDSYHWQAFNWIKDNTPIDSEIFLFHGDIYNQDALLRNMHRVHYFVRAKDYINSLQNKTIKREYVARRAADYGTGMPYRKSFFSFGSRLEDAGGYEIRTKKRDICIFDYYIFDKASQQPVLAQYNMLIANELLQNEWIQAVYGNEYVIILENNKPGDDCIDEKRID